MKRLVGSLLCLMMLLALSVAAEEAAPVPASDTIAGEVTAVANKAQQDQYVVYYLHMNRRCATCQKLQAYSEEAVASGFAEQLKDSSLIWRVANFEEEGNEHFAKEYQLYSQAVVVSKLQDGKESRWKNLDQIWLLVNDKEEFITYVQAEVADFMKPVEDK